MHPLPCTQPGEGATCACPRCPPACWGPGCCSWCCWGRVIHHYYSGLSQKGWLCSGAKYEGGFWRSRKGPEFPKSQGGGEAPASSVWQVPGADGRSQHWSWRGGGSWGAHLEGRLCPTTEGLLLATELVALAQLQQPLPSQLFQSGVYRSCEGAEVGVGPGAQSKHTEPGVPGGIRVGPLILAPVPRQLTTPPAPHTQQSSPCRGPRPEGPQRPRAVRVAGLLSLPPPGGHQRV